MDLSLQKYIKQPRTIFDVHKLSYYQHKYHLQDEGCGILVYTPQFWTEGKLAGLIFNKEWDYDQPEHWRYYLDAYTGDLEGVFYFDIDVVSSVLTYGPTHTITITIDALPCYVDYIDTFR